MKMNKKPETIRDCIIELVSVIEETRNFTEKEKAITLDNIRNYLMAYLKLKEYAKEYLDVTK